MASLVPLSLLFLSLATCCIGSRRRTTLDQIHSFKTLDEGRKILVMKSYLWSNDSATPSSASGFHFQPIAFAIAFLLLLFSALFCWRIKKYWDRTADACKEQGDDPEVTVFSPTMRRTDFRTIIDELEQGGLMANCEMVGRGGCGEVYKVDLFNGDERLGIAIKKIEVNFSSYQLRQVRNETKIVGRMRHRNVLPLLAHVSRANQHYLIYEYMKNGSLHDLLTSVAKGDKELLWQERYKIAMDVACGLEYMHMMHKPCVVHRDMKPANVLLEDNLNARISDFGLAKLVPDCVVVDGASSSIVVGTIGYIAPEYFRTSLCTEKCDVYSFGVILAVLITCKFPNDDFFLASETTMVGWLRNVMSSDDPKVAIDPSLLGDGFEEQMLLVLKIALFCTYDDPKERPNSREVHLMLAQEPQVHGSPSTGVNQQLIPTFALEKGCNEGRTLAVRQILSHREAPKTCKEFYFPESIVNSGISKIASRINKISFFHESMDCSTLDHLAFRRLDKDLQEERLKLFIYSYNESEAL